VKGLTWWLAGGAILAALLGGQVKAQDRGTSDSESPAAGMDATKGRIDAMGEQMSTMQSDLDKLKKFKFSGYLQARYEINELSRKDTVTVATFGVQNRNRFYIRRGRLKLTYDSSPLSQAVIYLDGGEDRAVTLLEAYVTLKDPWTVNHRHALNVGQMNVPFGYEIERSSSVRELPERSLAENVLFKGERDRGVTLTSQWIPQLQTVLGFMNGPGIKHVDFPNSTPRKGKDFVGRVRWSQGIFDVAGSIYSGKNVIPLVDGVRDGSFTHDKTRYGADAQGYYMIPGLGGGSLKAEFYQGHEANPDSLKKLTSSRVLKPHKDAAHLATDFTGWYAMWVQNLGEQFQVAARYDVFDPNTDIEHDQTRRFGAAVNYFFDGNVRVTVAYDVPKTDKLNSKTKRWYDPKDNMWTVQFQHKF
jgi:phosphate-selective porin